MRSRQRIAPLAIVALLLTASPGVASEVWEAQGGMATFRFTPGHLESMGISIEATRDAIEAPEYFFEGSERPALSFELRSPNTTFHVENGRVVRFAEGLGWSLEGGFALAPEHGALPAFFQGAAVVASANEGEIRVELVSLDQTIREPLLVTSIGVFLDRDTDKLHFIQGDLRFSPEWARALGRPTLANQLAGSFDLTLDVRRIRSDAVVDDASLEPESAAAGTIIDVLLGELYDIGVEPMGREGTFPNGLNGLSAATTSCNNGNVAVPWNEPMSETHPFIGLALFRLKDGKLEQLGTNWIKHGWFALANNQCFLGCVGGGGQTLEIGCSDTYSAANNGERFVLGPREEVNPWTASWTALGSFFDATPVDGQRDYFGAESSNVAHRLIVHDSELGNLNADSTAARYFYEGVYYVADDDTLSNNIGHRECTMSWNGSNWSFQTAPVDSGEVPIPGPVINTWGELHDQVQVASDDGEMILAVQTTQLTSTYRYEYALYNRHSARGAYKFTIPISTSNLSNVTFGDTDTDGGNDWTSTISAGSITWETDDFVTDPSANYLSYQVMFTFSFESDFGPGLGSAQGDIFKPGVGTSFFMNTLVPTNATSVDDLASAGLSLALSSEPNPFRGATSVRFAAGRSETAKLSVVDVTGRTVQVLVHGRVPAGTNTVRWDGRDTAGRTTAAGVYFVRLETSAGVRHTKIVRIP